MNLKRVICFSNGLIPTVAVALFSCEITASAISYEPLSLKLPAPALKGRPEIIPVGPDIEPYSDKLPSPFLVPKGVTNLSAGKTVTSSTPPWMGHLSQITDGKKEAFDSDTVEIKKSRQWVQVDLGEPRLVYAIVMWHDHRYTQTIHDVIVQVSDDPEFEKAVTTLFNNDRDNSSGLGVGTDLEYFETRHGRIVDGKGLRIRYIRCYTNGSNLMAFNCWQEIEVYGFSTNSKSGAAALSSTNSAANETMPLKLQLPAPALK